MLLYYNVYSKTWTCIIHKELYWYKIKCKLSQINKII